MATNFDYSRVHGKLLKSAVGAGSLRMNDGSTSYDSVDLSFSDGLVLGVNCTEDTDELVCRIFSIEEERSECAESIPSLDSYRGRQLGWSWSAQNWRGYNDMILFGFDGVEPEFALVGMACKVHLFSLTPIRDDTVPSRDLRL